MYSYQISLPTLFISFSFSIAWRVPGTDVLCRNAVIPLRFNFASSHGVNKSALTITIGRVYPFALACSVATSPFISGIWRSMNTIEYVLVRRSSTAFVPSVACWTVNPDFLAANDVIIRTILASSTTKMSAVTPGCGATHHNGSTDTERDSSCRSSHSTGTRIIAVVPLPKPSDVNVKVPLCPDSIITLVRGNPNPVPDCASSALRKCPKGTITWVSWSGVMPRPLSATLTMITPSLSFVCSNATLTTNARPSLNFEAFDTKLIATCFNRFSSACTCHVGWIDARPSTVAPLALAYAAMLWNSRMMGNRSASMENSPDSHLAKSSNWLSISATALLASKIMLILFAHWSTSSCIMSRIKLCG